jgi:hypothetical protein
MFGPVKEALGGRRRHWRGAKSVRDATKTFFFSDGITKLVEHWNRCVEVEGDYVEK